MKKITIILFTIIAAGSAAGQNISIGANMVVEPGTQLHVDANLSINAAEMLIKQDATLIIGNSRTLSVNDGGAIKALGNETNQAIVSSTGYFVFIVSDGGTIGASHATFEKMSGSGLNIQPGATIDPANALSHCIFQHGSNGSTLLTINNHQHLTIEGAIFISSPGMELHNVAKTLNQGIVNFINYGGNFAGEDYEDDDYNRIFWGAEADFQQLVDGITAGEDVSLCFDALDVITVEDLLVDNGGMVDLVAGQRILMLPGVLVQNNGTLHAWISTDGLFCGDIRSMLIADNDRDAGTKQETMITATFPKRETAEPAFRVYPNPTRGLFTVELSATHRDQPCIVGIFTLLGERVLSHEMTGQSQHQFDLSFRPKGIYLVRVRIGDVVGMEKVVRR
jgi:hypothetical protein